MTLTRFQDRWAIVTGGASGIGRACAERFASEGAAVVLLDPDAAGLDVVVEAIQASGGVAVGVVGHSTDSEARRAAMQAAAGERPALLINCGASFLAKGLDATREDWLQVLETNVAGYALMTADAAPRLKGGGAVVNVASVSAHIAQPSRWTYNAAKGAVVALTRCQAMDLAPSGIRVNSVSPAWVWTPVVQALAGDDADARRREWGAYHLLGRIAEPEEVAAGIAFLASDEASFITATDLPIDGGYLAVGGEGARPATAALYAQHRQG